MDDGLVRTESKAHRLSSAVHRLNSYLLRILSVMPPMTGSFIDAPP